MEKFNSTACKQLRTEMTEALKVVEEKFGIIIKVGNMSYSDESVNVKVIANIEGAESQEEANYNARISNYNLPKLNSTVSIDGSLFKLVGWSSTARKYPIIAEKIANGKKYKLTIESVEGCVVATEG